MNRKRPLRPHEIEAMVNASDSDSVDFSADENDDDPDYECISSADESVHEDYIFVAQLQPTLSSQLVPQAPDLPDTSPAHVQSVPESTDNPANPSSESDSDEDDESSVVPYSCSWNLPQKDFIPRFTLPVERRGEIVNKKIKSDSNELEIFLQLFPNSLFCFIAENTNLRIAINNENKNQTHKATNAAEIKVFMGIIIIMSYNVLPSMANYWSKNASMGNQFIKDVMSRDRFLFLHSKIYFNTPEKTDESKTFYIDEVVSCFKYTFQKAYSDSSHQAIDESMVKFKGRSSLKQYMPAKPIKRGIKLWSRCDSLTGYLYDLNIYCGKETKQMEGTLGERVVTRLTQTIKATEVALCFDRFFTSIKLIDTLQFPAVGTYMSNRRDVPKFTKTKLGRGEYEAMTNNNGTVAVRWQDTKEVLLVSNCHEATSSKILRKQKTGEKLEVECPELCQFYNTYMGGVDLADQKMSTYDFVRKSLKWWKKVYYKLLFGAISNSWILFCQSRTKQIPQIDFIVALAEQLILSAEAKMAVKRRSSNKPGPSKKARMSNVGRHLPEMRKERRRCRLCTQNKKERKTTQYCTECDLPLCKDCFTLWHFKE